MKTTAKIICFVICCLALAFSQRTNAQPVFQAASIDSAPLGNRIPLILIHGIQSDPSMWNNFLNYYSAHPSLSNNFKPYTFAYKTDDTVMGAADPNDIFGLCPKLGNSLQQYFGTQRVAILAHSMGGLVARAMMEYYTYPDGTRGGDRVLALITLATPHHGTPAANEYIASYPLVPWFAAGVNQAYWLHPGFAYNMEWDCFNGVSIDNYCNPGIPSSADYSKIIAYGGQITSWGAIPSQDAELVAPYLVILDNYGYNNDGAVPIQSALFQNATGVRTRQVDGSCDHFEIYSGQKTVNGGTPIFDSIAADLATVVPISVPASPVISSVSPSSFTGLPIGQTRLIRVIGSGFSGSSTFTFNDGVTSYPGRPPIFVSANELDYNITTGTNQANWTVQVVNGAQTSNLGRFTVNSPSAPPQQYGSLVVNLSPAGAISAGAQWQVDGTGYNGSGQVVGYLTPGSHTVSFKPISGYTTPGNQAVTINANAQTTASGTYSVIAPSTYTLTLNQGGAAGYIVNQPFGSGNGSIYNSGAVVQLTANANFGYHFVNWSGDVSGTANPTTITMSGNKSVTAIFASGDPNLGTITVTIQPPEAVTAGVTWGFNDSDFRASGTSYSYYPETVWVELHNTNGWIGYGGWVTFTAGVTTNYTFAASYTNGSIIGSDPRTYYTLAGQAGITGSADGTNNSALFYNPVSLAVDNAGNVFVADNSNSNIRKVTPGGVVTTIAGQLGVTGYADGQGTNAIFNNIQGIGVDNSGNLYVADMMNSVIRKISTNGTVSTFAGQAGSNGSVDDTGSAARFYFPTGLAVDTNGNVYVSDSVNQTIRKITSSGAVTTLAGYPRSYGYADGTGSSARFHDPQGVAVDTSGNVYVAEDVNETVRKITPAGVVTTLAGYPQSAGAADGTGNAARFSYLSGVAVDKTGNIYVADQGNHAIRKITPAGVVTTLAGQSGNPGSADGIGSVARFYNPLGIAVDPSGNLYVADTRNREIRATHSLTTPVNQFITFAPLPNHSAGDAPFTLTATSSSGLPVYLNVLSGPASLDTNNVLTILGGGTVNLVAWQPGNSNYNAATPVLQSFNVSKIPQTITFGSLSQQKQGDAPFPLNATADSGLPVSFSIVSGPATLSGNILVLNGWGTVTVSASQPGNNSYAAATSVAQSFFVTPPDNTIVSPQRLSNGSFQLAFYGLTGSNYLIQTSTNLLDWQPFTNFTGTNFLLYFNDSGATNFKQRFYRAVMQ